MRFLAFMMLLSWIGGLALGAGQAAWWLLGAGALLLAALSYYVARSLPRSVACFVLLLMAALYAQPPAAPALPCLPRDPAQGVITTAPQLSSRSARYTVTLAGPPCTVLVVAERFPAYAMGDTITLSGGTPENREKIFAENPGYARYLEDSGIARIWRYPDIVRIQQSHLVRAVLLERVGQHITAVFAEPDASVVEALILADDSALPQYLEDNFRATGLTHLLAISGMNISLWAGLLLLVFAPLHLPTLLSGSLITAILWSYMYFLHWPVSAVRATVFWTLALLALRLRLLISLPSILLMTVFLLTTLQPAFFRDVGFQLSVAAVAGIFLMAFLTHTTLRTFSTITKAAAGALLVTIGATLATWPVIAYHFHTLSLLSIPANALVTPVVGLQMFFAAAALLLSLVSQSAALLPSFLTHLTVQWMDVVSRRIAHVPGSTLEELTVPLWLLAAYYGVLMLVAHGWLKWQGRRWREIWQ